MTDQPTAQQVIRAAVAAAGGPQKAAAKFGIASQNVSAWIARGRVPADKIKRLCDLGANVVEPSQILEALEREAQARAAV